MQVSKEQVESIVIRLTPQEASLLQDIFYNLSLSVPTDSKYRNHIESILNLTTDISDALDEQDISNSTDIRINSIQISTPK